MKRLVSIAAAIALAVLVSLSSSTAAVAGAKPPPPGTPPPELTPPPDQFPPLTVELHLTTHCIDITSHGVVPVVLFGSATFNVTKIVTSSLRLASAPAVNGTSSADRGHDGYLDLKAHFRQDAMALTPNATTITITGLLETGQPFTGSAPLADCGK
jgi:hypothetical protein